MNRQERKPLLFYRRRTVAIHFIYKRNEEAGVVAGRGVLQYNKLSYYFS